jgi:hypothetical protein
MVWRGIEDARALGRAFSLAHGLLMGSLTLLLLNDGNASSREARPSRKPRPSRRPLWRSLASGKHTLAAAAMTPETFDECRDRCTKGSPSWEKNKYFLRIPRPLTPASYTVGARIRREQGSAGETLGRKLRTPSCGGPGFPELRLN